MRFLVVPDIHGHPSEMGWLMHHGALNYVTLGDLSSRPALNGVELHRYLFEQGGMREVVRRLCDFPADGLIGIGSAQVEPPCGERSVKGCH